MQETSESTFTIDHRVSYNMAEFNALKSEISNLVGQTIRNLNYAIAVSGGVLAWLLTHSIYTNFFSLAKGIPFFVAALFAAYSAACYARIAEKGAYLADIERALSLPGLGWEETFSGRKSWIGFVNFTIWLVLLVGTFSVWILLPEPTMSTRVQPTVTLELR